MGKSGTGKVLRTCNFCKNEFLARHDRIGKYCSRSCAGKDRPRKNFKSLFSCLHCGKEFIAKRYRKETAKFCSRQCLAIVRGIGLRKENHPKWAGGISERSFHSRKLIELKKKEIGQCEQCGSKEKLEGHHVKGFKNDLEDIKILCSECHSKEHPRLAGFIRGKYD